MVAQSGPQIAEFVEVCPIILIVLYMLHVFLIPQFKLCSQCQDYVISGLVSSSFLHCVCLNLHVTRLIYYYSTSMLQD